LTISNLSDNIKSEQNMEETKDDDSGSDKMCDEGKEGNARRGSQSDRNRAEQFKHAIKEWEQDDR
jgi:hypothetical protein